MKSDASAKSHSASRAQPKLILLEEKKKKKKEVWNFSPAGLTAASADNEIQPAF